MYISYGRPWSAYEPENGESQALGHGIAGGARSNPHGRIILTDMFF
jgi:hypothetical protein